MSGSVIFLGPTLPKSEAAKIFGDAVYLPPAAQGDVYAAYKTYNPRFIGLIDGYFECVPSVWHKEILFVMSEGIHVAGSSSMGALRAAELYQFGMTGIGHVFEAYKTGLIEDDDEVAVTHGPEAIGYPMLSEAMINIRMTLRDAKEQGVIGEEERRFIMGVAKNLHYKNRTYDRILEEIVEKGFPSEVAGRFKEWLPEGRRDVKHEDAMELVRFLKEQNELVPEPKQVEYKFENTMMWMKLLESVSAEVRAGQEE